MLKYIYIRCALADTEALIRKLKEFDTNGVIVHFNYDGDIIVAHCPPHIKLKRQYKFYTVGTWTANRWIKWNRLIFIMTKIIFDVTRQSKVEYLALEGFDVVAWTGQIFKLFGRVKHSILLMHDWSLPNPRDPIANRIKMWMNDNILSLLDLTVVQTVKQSYEVRGKILGKKRLHNTILRDHYWAWFLEREMSLPLKKERRSFVSLGNLRDSFCLEMVFSILPDLNREFGFRMKVISPETAFYAKYKALSEQMGVSSYIDWLGFLPNEDLLAALKDCFCGINLQQEEKNPNQLAVAGRVVVYIQHLVVPLMTHWSGPTVSVVEEHKLGVICEPNPEAIRAGIIEAFNRNSTYVKNLDEFLAHNPYQQSFARLFEDASARPAASLVDGHANG